MSVSSELLAQHACIHRSRLLNSPHAHIQTHFPHTGSLILQGGLSAFQILFYARNNISSLSMHGRSTSPPSVSLGQYVALTPLTTSHCSTSAQRPESPVPFHPCYQGVCCHTDHCSQHPARDLGEGDISVGKEGGCVIASLTSQHLGFPGGRLFLRSAKPTNFTVYT